MKYTKKTNSQAVAPISHTNDQLTYAYIDAQNLHQSSKHWGWKLDYVKFRQYLRAEFNVTIAYLFMGYIQENQEIYSNLQKQGYILVFRETSEVEEHIKGNCDVELVMQAMLDYNEYQQAIVVTGDGDFTPLIRHLNSNGKLKNLLIPNRESYSKWLNKTAKGKMTYINLLKSSLFAPMHPGDGEEHPVTPQVNHQPRPAAKKEVTEKPRQFRYNSRNQPSVIKFYNTETAQEIKPDQNPKVQPEPKVEPILAPQPEISAEISELAPKKPRRGRTPRPKKTDLATSEPSPDLSKPVKDVSIFL